TLLCPLEPIHPSVTNPHLLTVFLVLPVAATPLLQYTLPVAPVVFLLVRAVALAFRLLFRHASTFRPGDLSVEGVGHAHVEHPLHVVGRQLAALDQRLNLRLRDA